MENTTEITEAQKLKLICKYGLMRLKKLIKEDWLFLLMISPIFGLMIFVQYFL